MSGIIFGKFVKNNNKFVKFCVVFNFQSIFGTKTIKTTN